MSLLTHDINNHGFVLWETLAACGVLAIALHALMGMSLAMINAESMRSRQQAAQRWALSMADQLAAGTSLAGRVVLEDEQLPSGIACLSEHPPWQLLSIRWQQERRLEPSECQGEWPPAQQLCLDQGGCA